jgi:hypothetical protein
MLKLKVSDVKEDWIDCTPEAKSFASQNLKEGDDVEVVYVGSASVPTIQQIGKVGTIKTGSPAPAVSTPAPVEGAKQEETTTARPTTVHVGKYRDPMNPDESRAVRRLSVMTSTCNAVNAVTSQVDPNGLADYIIVLFNKLLAEVEK